VLPSVSGGAKRAELSALFRTSIEERASGLVWADCGEPWVTQLKVDPLGSAHAGRTAAMIPSLTNCPKAWRIGSVISLPERCGTMPIELSALFEREYAPVAQRIRAADFGLSRPMRCGTERGRGSEMRRVFRCPSARMVHPTHRVVITGAGHPRDRFSASDDRTRIVQARARSSRPQQQ